MGGEKTIQSDQPLILMLEESSNGAVAQVVYPQFRGLAPSMIATDEMYVGKLIESVELTFNGFEFSGQNLQRTVPLNTERGLEGRSVTINL